MFKWLFKFHGIIRYFIDMQISELLKSMPIWNTWTVIRCVITSRRSRGRPVTRAGTLARSCSGSGSGTTGYIAIAPTAPMCPMSKFLAKMKVLYYYFCILIRSTGSRQVDRHVTRRRALSLIGWSTPVNETGSSTSDQVNCNYEKCIIILSNLWIEYLGSTVQSLFTKKTPTFFKELMEFFMRTINPERVFFF